MVLISGLAVPEDALSPRGKKQLQIARLTQGSKTVQRADTQGMVAAFCEKGRCRERTNTSRFSFPFPAVALSSGFVLRTGDKEEWRQSSGEVEAAMRSFVS